MKHLASAVLVMGLVVLTGRPLHAQVVSGRQLVKAALLAGPPAAGRPFLVGIQFTIEPDWYLYWKNPGDAGLPIAVQWKFPDGWKAGPLQFPVPSKFVHDDIVAYGYKKSVILLCEITPAGEPTGTLRADLDWLVCRESCLRGKTSVSLRLDPSGESTLPADAGQGLPEDARQLGLTLGPAIVHSSADGWTCELPLEGSKANAVTDFFPSSSDDVFLNYSSIHIAGNRLVFALSRENKQVQETTVTGLILAGGKGYEYTFPLKFPSQ